MVEVVRGERPDPGPARDLAEFIGLLGQLRVWAGAPSFRTLAKRVGPLMRPPQTVATSTIADVFQVRRQRLNLDMVVATVRALGIEGPELARWRAACVALHTEAGNSGTGAEAKAGAGAGAGTGGPAQVGVLRQLPADLATFTGRGKHLSHLIGESVPLSDGGAQTVVISAIEGMAGIGKTQLAIHAAHALVRAGRYVDVQLYVDLRGFDPEQPPVDPSAVLETFLRQLDVPAQCIPDGLAERAAMYRDRLSGREALVLLDNAADEQQVRDLIPASAGCLVLVTSRRSLAGLDGATAHLLDVFDPDEAVELLARIAGADRVGADPDAARRIVEACGLLPLAVALAAARLRSRPAWSMAELAHRLRDGGLNAVSAGGRSLRPVFDLSYQGLPSDAQRMFRLLGLNPGDDFCVAAAAALAGVEEAEAQDVLELLQDEHLLQQRTPGRYALHDLLRAYAAELATDDGQDERTEALHRVLSWYTVAADAAAQAIMPSRYSVPIVASEAAGVSVRFADSAGAMAWFDAEQANLLAAATLFAYDGRQYLAWRLPVAMSTFLGMRWRWQDWDRVHRIGLLPATESGDLAGEAWTRNNLGISAMELGRPEEAVKQLLLALQIRRRIKDDSGEAATLSNLTNLHGATGRPELGLEYAHQALEVARKTGDRRRESSALNSIGGCLRALDRPREALEHLHVKLKMHREDGDQRGLALALHNIGETHLVLHEYTDAAEAHREALAVSQASGDRHGQGGALFGIAKALAASGRPEEALEYFEQALALFDELEAPEAAEVRRHLSRIAGHATQDG